MINTNNKKEFNSLISYLILVTNICQDTCFNTVQRETQARIHGHNEINLPTSELVKNVNSANLRFLL